MSEPWAFVAHKDGKLGGVCAATGISRRSLRQFLSEFAEDEFSITPIFSREEYLAFTDKMSGWDGDAA